MFTALLIGVQLALSFVSGVELVTVTLATFSVVFGSKRGCILAISFSLLRCLVFGFYPTVIVLYLLYFPTFALICGQIGKLKGKVRYIVLVVSAVAMTACFTLIDDVSHPLMMGFKKQGVVDVIFYSGFLAMVPQCICAAVSLLLCSALFKIAG